MPVLVDTSNPQTPLPYIDILGKVINSDFLNNLSAEDAKVKILKRLESDKIGNTKITYRLKDWGVSRQRYWGVQFPIIYAIIVSYY